MLQARKIKHVVLNAKYHEREADIVAQAGARARSPSPPTWRGAAPTSCSAAIPKALAGKHRGRPGPIRRIRGGEDCPQPYEAELRRRKSRQVLDAGGLHIIGTERHESRRIDNQLRGRSGRQGDPGSSRFFLSLEDDLMRIFASDWVRA